MCFASSPSIPAPPPPPEPTPAPRRLDPETQRARNQAQQQARRMAGAASLNTSGPRGLTSEANTNRKRLLGA